MKHHNNKGSVRMKVVSPKDKYKDDHVYNSIVTYCLKKSKCKSGYIVRENLYSNDIASEMKRHAEYCKKDFGTRIRHVVITADGENATFETMLDLAETACAHYRDSYQIFAAVHEDTDHPHCHVIMNTVGLDGTKYKGRKKDYYSFQNDMRKAAQKHHMKFYVDGP